MPATAEKISAGTQQDQTANVGKVVSEKVQHVSSAAEQIVAASGVHTPGPWAVVTTRKPHSPSSFWHEIKAAEGERSGPIAEVYEEDGDGDCDRTSLPNARLIAAAPEMLVALKALVEMFGTRSFSSPEDPDALLPEELQEPEVAQAMRLIAKAEVRP